MTDHDALAAAIDEAFAEAPRLSPAARRFAAGEMTTHEARELGFSQPDGSIGYDDEQ